MNRANIAKKILGVVIDLAPKILDLIKARKKKKDVSTYHGPSAREMREIAKAKSERGKGE